MVRLNAPLWTDRGLKTITTLTLDVLDEADRQMGKWGEQVHTPAEWAVIVGEEAGEAMKELCEAHFRPSLGTNRRVVEESIQAATLFLKIAEMARETYER